ncbi:hypothetical protein AVI51_09730 [Piscirickettsia salmonis]|uniref:Membrane protein n=1 Tax=Piscirickettsia salmonis TaxID=1238 RepID=A0A095DN47_PISSA|nr:DMT family protein [Piscirickettsia salmonis]RNC76930.1 hypothetical protein DA717_13180 [Piscirickettsiaceae bacterium NZ-RLO2]AKP72379.1 hypothetical protein PSLF89_189 [Piscirickettsia salmonis LF-89 = ATCC VR-1361]ALA23652.1 membrane protein [Piscirickettsia salmonis]ALB24169.1 membrane protein [Piscirickettsia salmonis]ALY03971.1 hypothetical protein AWE47_14765 [Piscirickettsia salmonis]
MPPFLKTVFLLICSNTIMSFAWYGNLKTEQHKAFWIAILTSWGIAFFEYIFLIPANRTGFLDAHLSLAQLKIIQEVISLSIFVPFAIFYMKQTISWNFLWAGFCLAGAVYFIFK